MPKRPKHPCSYPGCRELTDRRYCPEHERLMNRLYEKYERDAATRKRYGHSWKRIRDRYAATHPFCEECMKNGRYVRMEEVHHKLPLRHGGTHDEENLAALCHACHARIHARNGDRWHNRPRS